MIRPVSPWVYLGPDTTAHFLTQRRARVPRNFPDFLSAYIKYAGVSEAPTRMHFFSGFAAVAGALRRRVWLPMGHFRWAVNNYFIFCAPPGIVQKSTTVAIAMDLLRTVPLVYFGPAVITWPALVKAFAEVTETFDVGGVPHKQCALTLESSELGNLLDPQDRWMMDLLITLWDSREGGISKVTKGSGSERVINPFINMVACTTPSWIAANFPESIIGGGFTSRCLFIYADAKEKLLAYPIYHMPADMAEVRQKLIEDLTHISEVIAGPYELSSAARAWGEAWYENWNKHPPRYLQEERFLGYLDRKQTHLHKLAMIIAASCRDERVLMEEDLQLAETMISNLEPDMPKVFGKMGKTDDAVQAERFIQFVRANGPVSYTTAYQYVHAAFPFVRDFEGIVAGAVKAGLIQYDQDTHLLST